ncbi:hypothetical protein CXG81DRAFT_10426 [Caulochytrium protostelioides]|uniref:DNA replication complex GINS protein PSF1 n=1 Tax=Caulochytrium protostelioides TaxID=1555241 RepID=A0A4V1IV42_9FUNG|nr:hypothetical protein CXG81DRAFT_10426 [Caulochytrium protostelioides]|eukprot:RKP02749.1 hypothetical protein CXG81DRAFT_10426 [Caulochytrium protostelioides]
MASCHGDRALALVREAKRTQDAPFPPPYRDDIVRDVVAEINALFAESARRLDLATLQADPVGAATAQTMHRLGQVRSKRCVLAYLRHRLDRFREAAWDIGNGITPLPAALQAGMAPSEVAFLAQYRALVGTYRADYLTADLGASLHPPKEVYIEIRVLEDCGHIETETGSLHLRANSQHYVRRADVEGFIRRGLVQHIG